MKISIWFVVFVLILFCKVTFAQSSPGVKKQMVSFSVMSLMSSTKQGGEGPAGSTTLSQTEYVYAWPTFAVGAVFLYDMQGSSEKDSAYGPKVEAAWDPFYIEYVYLMNVTRAYTDRAVANQTGTGSIMGLGARFKLGAAGGGGGWFFQASYKYRTMNITKQDGSDISESIQQTDGYPLVGIGYQF